MSDPNTGYSSESAHYPIEFMGDDRLKSSKRLTRNGIASKTGSALREALARHVPNIDWWTVKAKQGRASTAVQRFSLTGTRE